MNARAAEINARIERGAGLAQAVGLDAGSIAFVEFGVRLGLLDRGMPATDASLDFLAQRLATISRMHAVANGPGWIDEDPPEWGWSLTTPTRPSLRDTLLWLQGRDDEVGPAALARLNRSTCNGR